MWCLVLKTLKNREKYPKRIFSKLKYLLLTHFRRLLFCYKKSASRKSAGSSFCSCCSNLAEKVINEPPKNCQKEKEIMSWKNNSRPC